MLVRRLHTPVTGVKTELLHELEEVTRAMLSGDFSKRVNADFDDEITARIARNINLLCDRQKLNGCAADINQEVDTFLEVISSFANLDFKTKLPISENGTVMDAIATGINLLGEELEQTTASKADLENERNRLREAQAIAKVGSWEVDMKSLRVSMSEQAYRILGLNFVDQANFFQMYSDYRAQIHVDDLDRVDRITNEAITQAKPFVFEHRAIVNGEEKTILCISETVLDEQGSVAFLKGTFQDISESKRNEEALKSAKNEAEQSNHAKSRFLANMSHEIRTPLNGILGLADILSRETLSDEHRNYVELIRHSGKNLTQLINDILDLSKIESGKLVLENIPFSFRASLESTIAPYAYLASQKGLSFYSSIDPAIPDSLAGDPTRIAQVIVNLLGNAIKFTDTGSIAINFSLHSASGDAVVLKGEVKDTGPGIPFEKLETVFDSFSQADEAVSRKFGGTGLGLSIVKSLVSQMNGSVSVTSELQSGTTFTFFLSLRKTLVVQDGSAVIMTAKLKFNEPLRIMVVDDNRINLIVASRMLTKLGADVVTAEGAREALEISGTQHFDLIFMDIQMPEINGYEATRILRERNFTNPIIALSANAYREDVEGSLAAGMDGHMQKPFTERQLYEAVSGYLSKTSGSTGR